MELFPFLGEEIRLPPPQGFSPIRMWIVLAATIDATTTQDHFWAYRTLNHKLVIESGRLSTIHISRDTRLCHFFSYNVVENESHFMLGCPYTIPLEIKVSILRMTPHSRERHVFLLIELN